MSMAESSMVSFRAILALHFSSGPLIRTILKEKRDSCENSNKESASLSPSHLKGTKRKSGTERAAWFQGVQRRSISPASDDHMNIEIAFATRTI